MSSNGNGHKQTCGVPLPGCAYCGGSLKNDVYNHFGFLYIEWRCMACGRSVVPPRLPTLAEQREASLYRFHVDDESVKIPGERNIKKGCVFDYCDRKHFAKGYCHGHYFKARRLYLDLGEDDPFLLVQQVALEEGMIEVIFYEMEEIGLILDLPKSYNGCTRIVRFLGDIDSIGWTRRHLIQFSSGECFRVRREFIQKVEITS